MKQELSLDEGFDVLIERLKDMGEFNQDVLRFFEITNKRLARLENES